MTVEEGVDTEEHSVVDGGFVSGYMKSPRNLGEGIGRVGKGHWDECGACQRQYVLVKFNPESQLFFLHTPCLALFLHSFFIAWYWFGFQPLRFLVCKSSIVRQMF